MNIALSLVGLTFLVVQCRCRAVRDSDRQYSVETLLYQPTDHRNFQQERTLQQQVSRTHPERYQYQYEDDQSYPQETQYEPNFSETPTNQLVSRPKQGKQLPVVEQYLKEVTPTTKTVYDPRTYQRTRESKRIQYTYRAESQQQQPLYQSNYEDRPKEVPVPQNILAHQNALIAKQNAIYEQQRADQLLRQQQDAAAKSALYLQQKIVKPKPSSLDEEIAYYTKLQYEQQQSEQQNGATAAKQSAPTKYQTRIPQNAKPELLLATEEEQGLLYQPESQYNAPTRILKPSEDPKEQVYLSDIKYQQKVVYQPVRANEEVKYYEQPQQLHYQLQPSGTYLSEQKQVRFQEPRGGQIQQNGVPSEEYLQKYRESIANYQPIQASRPTKPRPQASQQYVPEHTKLPQRYQAQQYSEPQQVQPQHQSAPYLGPTEEEYKQSQFKQSLGRNSSLRILKTGKPVVFVGHEE